MALDPAKEIEEYQLLIVGMSSIRMDDLHLEITGDFDECNTEAHQ